MSIARDAAGRRVYSPDGKTLAYYIADQAPVVIIRGPIGSGTSSASCVKIWHQAVKQKPGPDGVRRSRWAVVRNTYQQLQDTTLKTWLNWFPEDVYGEVRRSRPFQHVIRYDDGQIRVELEVIFLALDDEGDVSKLRSLELTGVWFNELEFNPREIFDEAHSRCGRYPPISLGGASWYGVIADMNAPPEDHWVPMLMGEVPPPPDCPEEDLAMYERPSDWAYHVQPAGLLEEFGADGKTVVGYRDNPEAENLRWLPQGFYQNIIKGKSKEWIDARIMNRIIPRVDGKPVWPMFKIETHVAKTVIRFNANHSLLVGLDFGRRPAAVFGQLINDRWAIVGELEGIDEGASKFAPRVRRWIFQNCPGLLDAEDANALVKACRSGRLRLWGDPKGQDKVQSDETTAYDVFRDHGLLLQPAPIPSNAIQTRIDAVEYVLNGMRDGMARFLLSPDCRTLRMAMAGGYHFKKGDSQRIEPVKDRYSNLADALQYLIIGAGEGSVMTGRDRPGMSARPPVQAWKGRRSLRRV